MTDDGRLYEMILNPTSDPLSSIRRVDLSHIQGQIIYAAAENYRKCVVMDTNQVYCWGMESKLGYEMPDSGNYFLAPERPVDLSRIPPNETIVSVTTGENCAALLSKSGRIYAWGNGMCLANSDQQSPSAIPVPQKYVGSDSRQWSEVGVHTSFSTACAISEGTVYCWGEQGYNLLGNGGGVYDTLMVPTPVVVAPPG
ncbi:MAG: hypothetical protein HYZ71_09670 [Deltaproteobacteria bacterium]|nr:hypothetical protein [Deltaproteobacteria bacterium]